MRQIISALYFCHEEVKVVHRDIKPENFVLNSENDIVLVDFGLSRRFEGDDDVVKLTQGTKAFYAPEIVRTGVVNKVIHGK